TREWIEIFVRNLLRVQASPERGGHRAVNLLQQCLCLVYVLLKHVWRRDSQIDVALEQEPYESGSFCSDQAVLRKHVPHVLGLHFARVANHVVAKAEVGNCMNVSRGGTNLRQLI